jgi:hypothetical protein
VEQGAAGRDVGTREDVVSLLHRAKAELVRLSNECASGSQFERAQRLLNYAESIGQIEMDLGSGFPVRPSSLSAPLHFYVDDANKLVMRAASRTGGSYAHRVPRPHFDQILQKMIALADDGEVAFSSQSLQDSREMPVHEPLLVVRLLAKQGLIERLRKGHFKFRDAAGFAAEARGLWDTLPRR